MKDKLQNLKKEIFKHLEKVKDSDVLRNLEVEYLGRKGKVTEILRNIKNLDDKKKKEIGQIANEVKNELQRKFSKVRDVIEYDVKDKDVVDVTLPGEKIIRGHLNPITIIQNELEDLFTSLGFMIIDGPELESDYYNFEALNIPPHHPARDIQDTFYVIERGATNAAHANDKYVIKREVTNSAHAKKNNEEKNEEEKFDLVMRTHTSPMQIRAMQKYGAPIRCVVPGRTFRCEATDACHNSTFYQLEGLMVDKNISVANLIAVMKEMFSNIFKQDVNIRVRPGYFPFVEPGLEVDISCTICKGKGCSSCKYSGWLEMAGAGMVHPRVLKYGGVDPNKFSGFAFGMGIDRLAMMKYGINDIRLFHSGDLRFLEQF